MVFEPGRDISEQVLDEQSRVLLVLRFQVWLQVTWIFSSEIDRPSVINFEISKAMVEATDTVVPSLNAGFSNIVVNCPVRGTTTIPLIGCNSSNLGIALMQWKVALNQQALCKLFLPSGVFSDKNVRASGTE